MNSRQRRKHVRAGGELRTRPKLSATEARVRQIFVDICHDSLMQDFGSEAGFLRWLLA